MEMGNTLVSLSLGFISVLMTKIECITSIPWKILQHSLLPVYHSTNLAGFVNKSFVPFPKDSILVDKYTGVYGSGWLNCMPYQHVTLLLAH
jgi:hypothetical protein